MRKILVVFSLMLISLGTVFAQGEVANPKGSKGIIANFNNLDLSKGLGDDKFDNFSVGLSGYYFFADNIAVCPGLSYSNEVKSLFFTVGLRKWFFDSWFLGAWYEGFTNDYKTAGKIDFGYTHFLSDDIFIEPTLYWEKGFGDLNINRLGFMVSLGMCF